jgi:hypothetical protein
VFGLTVRPTTYRCCKIIIGNDSIQFPSILFEFGCSLFKLNLIFLKVLVEPIVLFLFFLFFITFIKRHLAVLPLQLLSHFLSYFLFLLQIFTLTAILIMIALMLLVE